MPVAVSARLNEDITEAKRLLSIEVFDAKLFKLSIVYTSQERKAFGITQDASFILIAQDGPAFEHLIPERKNGHLNYLRLNNHSAVTKIDACLVDIRAKQRGNIQK